LDSFHGLDAVSNHPTGRRRGSAGTEGTAFDPPPPPNAATCAADGTTDCLNNRAGQANAALRYRRSLPALPA